MIQIAKLGKNLLERQSTLQLEAGDSNEDASSRITRLDAEIKSATDSLSEQTIEPPTLLLTQLQSHHDEITQYSSLLSYLDCLTEIMSAPPPSLFSLTNLLSRIPPTLELYTSTSKLAIQVHTTLMDDLCLYIEAFNLLVLSKLRWNL
jgi:hypothetical protein